MSCLSVNFAFSYARHKLNCNDKIKAFVLAAEDFKKEIKAIRISKNKDGGSRGYLFSDGSLCTYDLQGDFFKFK